MPHYKDGTKARFFDRVIAPVYDSASQGNLPKEAVVVSIEEGASGCDLGVMVEARPGGIAHAGSSSGAATAFIHGLHRTASAKDCELVERVKDPPAVGTGG